jgi:predicted RNase H-like HicB family nuclease
MRYMVLLRRRPLGTYVAMAPAVPGCAGEGGTRDEALNRLKTALEDWLVETEITMIDVAMPEPGDGRRWHPEPVEGLNPWLMTAGLFADDPALEPMLQEIYAAREAERPVE